MLILQNQLDSKQQETDRLTCTTTELKEIVSRKEQELERILEEKDDILQKASELESKVIELDNIQRNDIESLETRVESTIYELRSAKEDNSNLLTALSKTESALADTDSKLSTFKDKYYSKKTEANVLRDKIEKLTSEISRLKADNSRMTDIFENKRVQVSVNENKSKV